MIHWAHVSETETYDSKGKGFAYAQILISIIVLIKKGQKCKRITTGKNHNSLL